MWYIKDVMGIKRCVGWNKDKDKNKNKNKNLKKYLKIIKIK